MVKLDEIRPRVYVYETAGPGALAWLRSCWERVFFGHKSLFGNASRGQKRGTLGLYFVKNARLSAAKAVLFSSSSPQIAHFCCLALDSRTSSKQYELEDLGERGLAFRCTLEPRLFGPTTQQEEKALAAFKQAWEILRAGWAKVLGNLSAQEREAAPRYFDFLQLKTILPIYAPDGRYIEAWQALYELSLPLAPAQDSLSRPPRVLLEGEYLSLELRGAYLAKAVFAHLPVQARRGSDLFAERFAQPAAMLFKRVNGRFLAPFFMGENGASPACKEAVGVGEMEDERPVPYSSFFGRGGVLYIDYIEFFKKKPKYEAYKSGENEVDKPGFFPFYFDCTRQDFEEVAMLLNQRFREMNLNLKVVVVSSSDRANSERPLTIKEFHDTIKSNNPFLSTYIPVATNFDFTKWYSVEDNQQFDLTNEEEPVGQAALQSFSAKIQKNRIIDLFNTGYAAEETKKRLVALPLGKTKRSKFSPDENREWFLMYEKIRREVYIPTLARIIEHESMHPKNEFHFCDDAPSKNAIVGGHVKETMMADAKAQTLKTHQYDPYMMAMLWTLHGKIYDDLSIRVTITNDAFFNIAKCSRQGYSNEEHFNKIREDYNKRIDLLASDRDWSWLQEYNFKPFYEREDLDRLRRLAVEFEFYCKTFYDLVKQDALAYARLRLDLPPNISFE